jgi:hypothetical protein
VGQKKIEHSYLILPYSLGLPQSWATALQYYLGIDKPGLPFLDVLCPETLSTRNSGRVCYADQDAGAINRQRDAYNLPDSGRRYFHFSQVPQQLVCTVPWQNCLAVLSPRPTDAVGLVYDATLCVGGNGVWVSCQAQAHGSFRIWSELFLVLVCGQRTCSSEK